ncbi:uncharacterized protein LOC142616466 [Castanea sativa]|uniref:uncharacterized protein LOC142616466 n=1 Tax=Castanea sativa TaxID=21020 RepID=UPI003F64D311
MPGIDPSVITYSLNVFPYSKPVRQKKRVFAYERDNAIKEEVQKLITAEFIREVYYPDCEFDVKYLPKTAIKAQVLADFIAEFTLSQDELNKNEGNERWVINVDGSSILYVGGTRVVLKSLEGDKLEYAARLQYQTINNEAEYEALLKGLELAKSLGAKSIIVKGDSQLVINQVNGMCDAKEDRMKKYLSKVRRLVQKFTEVSFVQLPREENMEADALAKAALGGEVTDVYDRIQYMPSIDLPDIQQIGGGENWMSPIVIYLKDGRLLEDKNEARKLRVRAAKYVLINEVLYKRGFPNLA